jgi:uncharacterized protein (DUF983 family)
MRDKDYMRQVIIRALRKLCPQCGQGKLMASYLKQVQHCAACGEAFGHIRADDAPPWATILIVGHVVVLLALEFEKYSTWPTWLAAMMWSLLALCLSLLILPRAKALFVGIIWATRAPGSERL